LIYLDHNATTPLAPEVAGAMRPYLEGRFGNPSSGYALGQEARHDLEKAREQVARALGASPDEIVFTSGGTESNNAVLKGAAHSLRHKGRHMVTTAIEHPAVINTCLFLMQQGMEMSFVGVDGTGTVRMEDLEKAIRPDTILISVMHANNETGVVQPLERIARIARDAGIPLHTDAAQSVGKIPTQVSCVGVDFLTLAGHKLYAPKGTGALYMKRGNCLEPLLHGGGQEMGRRAGTENVMGAVGLGAACELAASDLEAQGERLRILRDRLHELLRERIPGLCLNGHPARRLPNTLNVSFPAVAGDRLLASVPRVCASTGAACHDRSVDLSHVLAAMNVPKETGRGAVRLTLGRGTTVAHIEEAADLLCREHRRLAKP